MSSTVAPVNPTIGIGQICLANAMRDEKNETYRFGVRFPRYVELLQKLKDHCSIISIKEVRACRSISGEKIWSAQELLDQLIHHSNQDDIHPSNKWTQAMLFPVKFHSTNKIPTYFPMHLAHVYYPSKVCLLQTHCFSYYTTVFSKDPHAPPHMGGSMIAALYAPVNAITNLPDMDKKFLVESYHFPLDNNLKSKVIEWINHEYPIQRDHVFGFDTSKNIIRVGDFNTFSDDPFHQEHMSKLLGLRDEYLRIAKHMTSFSDPNKVLYGTFMPFPHDITPVNIIRPDKDASKDETKSSVNSVLDQCVFTSI